MSNKAMHFREKKYCTVFPSIIIIIITFSSESLRNIDEKKTDNRETHRDKYKKRGLFLPVCFE